MNLRHILLSSACALILTGCTDTEQFRVNGHIEGKPTMNIRVSYVASGAVHTLVTAAREGEFEFFASSPQPTLVEITDYEYRPLARLYACNGETFDITVDRANPLKASIESNDVTARWAAFLKDNSDVLKKGGKEANELVAAYISGHPDDIVSSLLLITAYDASHDALMADSLMSLITPQARPSGIMDGYNMLLQRLVSESVGEPVRPFIFECRDTARTFDPADSPASILAFTDDSSENYKTLADSLENIARKGRKVFDLRSIGTRGFTYDDSLRRIPGKLPGGLAARGVEALGIPELPYFIVTDTAGTQHYRGTSLKSASLVADSLSKK